MFRSAPGPHTWFQSFILNYFSLLLLKVTVNSKTPTCGYIAIEQCLVTVTVQYICTIDFYTWSFMGGAAIVISHFDKF